VTTATPPPVSAAKPPPATATPPPVTTATPPARPTRAHPWNVRSTYSAQQFDHVAFLGKALGLARQLLPDAKLIELTLGETFPEGRVVVSKGNEVVTQFVFRSPAASTPPEGERELKGPTACVVVVEVYPTGVSVYLESKTFCLQKFTAHPRCPITWVWKRARELGATIEHGSLSFRAPNQWFLRGSNTNLSIDENCPR